MKKFLFLGLLCCAVSIARACDVCGCSVGGPYFGILPQYHRHAAGLRWYDSRLETRHPESHHGEASLAREHFRSLELWGRWRPLARVQVLVALPWHFLESSAGGQVDRENGLGDATLLATYTLIDNARCGAWRHQWQVGGGVKLPTGQYDPALADQPTLQRGSGSWDWLATSIYTLRYGRLGLNADVTYRLAGENTAGYRYGDRLNAGARLFFWQEWKSGFAVLPNAGVLLETAGKDADRGELAPLTGGECLMATVGADFYKKTFSLGATLQVPAAQNLAGGQVEAKARVVASLAWLF